MVVRGFLLDSMQWFLLACACAVMLRFIIGPNAADRLIALNVLSALVLAFLVVRGVEKGRAIFQIGRAHV